MSDLEDRLAEALRRCAIYTVEGQKVLAEYDAQHAPNPAAPERIATKWYPAGDPLRENLHPQLRDLCEREIAADLAERDALDREREGAVKEFVAHHQTVVGRCNAKSAERVRRAFNLEGT